MPEQERRKSGGESQKEWLITFDPQKHKQDVNAMCIRASAIPTR